MVTLLKGIEKANVNFNISTAQNRNAKVFFLCHCLFCQFRLILNKRDYVNWIGMACIFVIFIFLEIDMGLVGYGCMTLSRERKLKNVKAHYYS